MIYEQKFILALTQTLLIEVPVLVFFVRYFYKKSDAKKIELHKIILIGIIASSLTLPYLWFVLPAFISDRFLYILLGEISIILIEMIIYNQFFIKLNLKRAFTISLIANALSVIAGLVIS